MHLYTCHLGDAATLTLPVVPAQLKSLYLSISISQRTVSGMRPDIHAIPLSVDLELVHLVIPEDRKQFVYLFLNLIACSESGVENVRDVFARLIPRLRHL